MRPSPADFGYERLVRFRDRFAGQECVVMGNGPSLRAVDFALIGNRKLFGLNKIHLGFSFIGRQPDFLVCANRRVLLQIADNLSGLECVKFLSGRAGLVLTPSPITFYFNSFHDPNAPRFSTDIVRHVHEGWTVTHVALQIAYYLGFTKVVIVGLDHHFPDASGQPNEARIMSEADRNHFSPDYFGFGQEWDLPDLAQSETSYREARRVYEAAGRIILDATEGGKCPIFERLSLREALARPVPALQH